MPRKMLSFPKLGFNTSSFQRTSKNPRRNASYDASKGGSSRLMTRRDRITCGSTIIDEASSTSTPTSTHRLPHDDRIRRTKKCDKGKEIERRDLGSISGSASIAYDYRSVVKSREEQRASGMVNDLRSTRVVPAAIDSASCSMPCPSMCLEPNDPLEVSSLSQRLHAIDMLCSVSPVIIDNCQEEPSLHDVLFPYRWTPHNIVFDSRCPEVAPHIVITPPPAGDWLQAAHVAESNRAPLQLYSHLPVPPFYGSTCRMHTYEEFMAHFHQPPPEPQPEADFQYELRPPSQHVFHSASFQQWIESTQMERLCYFMRPVVLALHRHLFKVAAIAASLKAIDLRARYDSPDFYETFERPYRWVDPIDAILSCCPVGVHHIPSPSPFSVPHILIHEAPPNDPSIVAANGTPMQVHDGGDILVVLSSRRTIVTYVNDPQYIPEEQACYRSTYSASTDDSAGPETPTDLSRVSSGFFDEVVGAEEISEFDYSRYAALVASEEIERPGSPTPDSPQKSNFYIEEDDDELPPLDDEWYSSIIDRTRGLE